MLFFLLHSSFFFSRGREEGLASRLLQLCQLPRLFTDTVSSFTLPAVHRRYHRHRKHGAPALLLFLFLPSTTKYQKQYIIITTCSCSHALLLFSHPCPPPTSPGLLPLHARRALAARPSHSPLQTRPSLPLPSSQFLSNPLRSRSSTQAGVQKQFGGATKRSALGEISNTRAAPGTGFGKKPSATKKAIVLAPNAAGMDTAADPSGPAVVQLPAGVDDIDRNDAHDPQLVSDYVIEIHDYMRELECQQAVTAGYMAGVQTEIKPEMRAILVDWLVEVHARFKLIPETLQLTVNIMDRYLEAVNTKRKELQLIGVTAMLIASKYEEMYPPEVRTACHVRNVCNSEQP